MGEGISNLLLNLPEKAQFRKYLIAALSERVNKETLAIYLNGESHIRSRIVYVEKCMREIKKEDNILYTTNYQQHTKRKTNDDRDTIETLTDFFLTTCKPINNPYGTILNRSVGKKQLFSSFKLLCNSTGIGYSTFLRVASELHVVKHKSNEFDLFHCPHCHDTGWNVQEPKLGPNPTDEERSKYLKYQTTAIHQKKVKLQWQKYHNILTSLDEFSLLIVQDIAKKFTQKKKCNVCKN